MRRTFTLLEFAGTVSLRPGEESTTLGPVVRVAVDAQLCSRGSMLGDAQDVADPYSGSPEERCQMAEIIRAATRSIADGLTDRNTPELR